MKIAFVGTECSGKSTLSKLLADKLNVAHIPDPYDRAVMYGHGVLQNCPDAWQNRGYINWLFEQHMHRAQYELEQGVEDFVADSATIVRAACALFYCGRDYPEVLVQQLVDKAVVHSLKYDVLIYLLPAIKYVDNGHRIYNVNVRRALDLLMRGLLDMVSLHARPKIVTIDPLLHPDDTVNKILWSAPVREYADTLLQKK